MTTPAKPRKAKGWRIRIRPVVQNPVENPAAVPNDVEEQNVVPFEKEQQHTDIHVKIEMDDMMTCDKEIQTKAPLSGVIRVLNSKQCNRKVQVKIPASVAAWRRDPKIVTLRKGLKQVEQEAEKLREQTVPRKKYEELQQQLWNLSQSESQAFEGWRKEQEKVAKVTRRLDIVIKHMDTLCSLYNDVLACRALAKNYALFICNDICN